ncbi:cation-translocating P-type ATPase [Candidatus Mycoplasma pogonae]
MHQDYPTDLNKGLNRNQIENQRQQFGSNIIVSKKNTPIYIKFLKHLIEPMMLLLIIAGAIAFAIALYNQISGHESHSQTDTIIEFVEPFVIWFIVLLNAFFGTYQEYKAEKNVEALEKMTAPTTTVLREGNVLEIPAKDVVVGDIVLIEAGNQITADGILLESAALEVNESLLTGESTSVFKDANAKVEPNAALGDRLNYVFLGTYVIHGRAKFLVINVGMNTEIGKISQSINEAKDKLTPLQEKVNRLGKWIGIGASILCLLTILIYILFVANVINFPERAQDYKYWVKGLLVAITLAIGTIPEGLLPIMTVILSSGVRNLAKKNAIVKKISSAETLGSVSIICSDKTGTLTQNKMTVTKLWDSHNADFMSNFTTPSAENLLTKAILCTDGSITIEADKQINLIGDPTETSILDMSYQVNSNLLKTNLITKYPRVAEIPFESDRKMMSVIVKDGNDYLVITKGAPDQVFQRLKNYNAAAAKANEMMGHDALRVLAVAIKKITNLPIHLTSEVIESNLELVGLIGIIDPPRQEVYGAISENKKAGIKTVMITGDHANTAGAIAKDLKILNPGEKIITGAELALLSDAELQAQVQEFSVYARVSPSDKIRIVKAWQANGHIVSMTGDGVNDAPALKSADIGCAMGITGTDVSKQAADLILTDDNFTTIVNAVRQGRGLLYRIKKLMVFLFATNLAAMFTTFIGILIFASNPLSALQILWINVISETFPGIALGFNDEKVDLMNRKPLPKNAPIITRNMFLKILFLGLFASMTSLLMFYIGAGSFYDFNFLTMRQQLGTSTIGLDAYHFGSGLAFLTLGLNLSANSLIIGSSKSIFNSQWSNTKILWLGFIVSLLFILFVVYVPGVNTLFNMAPYASINFSWLNAIPFIIGGLFLSTTTIIYYKKGIKIQ